MTEKHEDRGGMAPRTKGDRGESGGLHEGAGGEVSRPGVTGNKVEHRRWELAAEAATAAAERKRLSLLLAIEFTGAAVLLKRGGRWISTSGVRTRGGGSGGKAIPAASPGTTFFRLYRPETAAQCCNVLSPGCWSTSAAERETPRVAAIGW